MSEAVGADGKESRLNRAEQRRQRCGEQSIRPGEAGIEKQQTLRKQPGRVDGLITVRSSSPFSCMARQVFSACHPAALSPRQWHASTSREPIPPLSRLGKIASSSAVFYI